MSGIDPEALDAEIRQRIADQVAAAVARRQARRKQRDDHTERRTAGLHHRHAAKLRRIKEGTTAVTSDDRSVHYIAAIPAADGWRIRPEGRYEDFAVIGFAITATGRADPIIATPNAPGGSVYPRSRGGKLLQPNQYPEW